ncbi:hypothetical protein WOLCODRAFT_158012 [Wolfiporia cocos MD-104 SS10]|uniref:RING-type domain-containing protein n=1 Tax=Wolfiporia cocos (strain MD-104) TaxID=742152 RepID=A0A2H3J4W3_WOLCO|nr:hypothetical protein WOLCODRAFT_158012 [Wolfiporia cocos MD-104 SS10]
MPAQRTTRHASRQPSHVKASSSSPTPGPDPEAIDISSDEDTLSSRRSSVQPRRTQAKGKGRLPPLPHDVIEISSDEDTLSSRRSSVQPRRTQAKGKGRLPPLPHDVIEISSDEDTLSSRRSSVQPRRRKTQAKGKGRLPPPPHDIIDISSDEEDGPPRCMPTSPVASRRRQPQNTRAESRRPGPSTHRRATSEPSATEPSMPISMLEDHIGCEICLLPMWTPYALSCGHTFCHSCLQEWFSTILAHHMDVTPGYNHLRIAELNAQLREPELPLQMRHRIIALLSSIEAKTPSPTYSCPSCRATATSRPSEVFTLKNIVRAIATAKGESPPKKPLPPNAAPSGAGGLWDGFFPRTTY